MKITKNKDLDIDPREFNDAVDRFKTSKEATFYWGSSVILGGDLHQDKKAGLVIFTNYGELRFKTFISMDQAKDLVEAYEALKKAGY